VRFACWQPAGAVGNADVTGLKVQGPVHTELHLLSTGAPHQPGRAASPLRTEL
jgi:hypothetical protein